MKIKKGLGKIKHSDKQEAPGTREFINRVADPKLRRRKALHAFSKLPKMMGHP